MRKWLIVVALLLLPSPLRAQQALLADLQAERAKYGASMTSAEVGQMLNAVAWRNRASGWGLLKKGSGNSCPMRDVYVSCDILIHAPTLQHFDVLIDAEGRAEPTWNLVGPCILGPSSGCEMSRYLAPFDPGGSSPVPNPGPIVPSPGTPPTLDLSAVISRLDALYDQAERMKADADAQRKAAMDAETVAHAQILDHVDNPGWFKQVFGNRYVQMLLAGVATWVGSAAAK